MNKKIKAELVLGVLGTLIGLPILFITKNFMLFLIAYFIMRGLIKNYDNKIYFIIDFIITLLFLGIIITYFIIK